MTRLARGRSLPIALYPLAVPVAAVVHWWASESLHPALLMRPVAIVILVGVAVTFLTTAIVGERNRGAVAAWAILVGLTVYDLRAAVLLCVVGLVVIAVCVATRNVAWPRGPAVTRGLSILATILLLTSLIDAVQSGAVAGAIDDVRRDVLAEGPGPVNRPAMPDIYVFILDAYPGRTAALTEPAFDASRLTSALEARGFDVAADSRANYLSTRLTVPSVFAAAQLPDLPGVNRPGTRQEDARALRDATEHGVVLRLLGTAGYERIAVSSGFGEIGPRRVDRLISPPQVDEFEAAVLRSTAAGRFIDALSPGVAALQKRDRLDATFEAASALAAEAHDRPRFVLVHVPGPHGPWVVDAAGAAYPDPTSYFGAFTDPIKDLDERRRRFFAFSTYIGDRTVAAIDNILGASPTPPVIAIFSDHGPDIAFDSHDPLGSDLDQRTSNYMAVLAPNHPGLLPDDATPVNLFPFILNAYLGTDLPIQPDTMWAWRTGSSILDFVEIDPETWKAR
jgi:hypothetical protein